MTIKILQKLEDRLKDVAETVGPCSATLYGAKHEGGLLIIGLSIQNESNLTIETNNPYGLDLLGIAEIRKPTSDDDLCAKLKDFPVKTPIVINVTAAGSLKSRRLVDGKLTSASYDIVEDDEFLSSFMFVNFVASAAEEAPVENAEPAEEAMEISSKPEDIKRKLTSEPPNFKVALSDVTLDSDVTPFDVFSENPPERDPRLPENLAILTVELEFPYDTKFLRKVEGKEGTINNINTICLVEKENSANLLDLLIGSVLRNLANFDAELHENGESRNFSAQIFYPPEVGYVLCAIFPLEAPGEVLLKKRLLLHECLGLSTAKPNFTGSLALSHFFGSSPAVGYTGEKHLYNVHETVKPPKLKDAQITTVRGIYSYFHYLQDGEKDDGWGCAYRSLQTIFSWFRWQGYVSVQVPSIKEIQETLVKIKDKPESFIGSKQWIGSQELCYVMDETAKVMCRIIHVPSGKGMLDERYAIQAHFEEQGTPIMVGGGQYAYTILGIACADTPQETRFLILDPHYVGPHDLKSILKKNGIAWRAVDLFKNEIATITLTLITIRVAADTDTPRITIPESTTASRAAEVLTITTKALDITPLLLHHHLHLIEIATITLTLITIRVAADTDTPRITIPESTTASRAAEVLTITTKALDITPLLLHHHLHLIDRTMAEEKPKQKRIHFTPQDILEVLGLVKRSNSQEDREVELRKIKLREDQMHLMKELNEQLKTCITQSQFFQEKMLCLMGRLVEKAKE